MYVGAALIDDFPGGGLLSCLGVGQTSIPLITGTLSHRWITCEFPTREKKEISRIRLAGYFPTSVLLLPQFKINSGIPCCWEVKY